MAGHADPDPTESCSPDTALGSSSFSSSWTSSSSLGDGWTTTAGKVNFGADGALFTINGAGDAPTIQSDFYFFFGSLEVTMKAAPGVGIVSSIVLLSDTLDEVDWEFVGGDATQTQTNYFGKGNTTTYDRAIWYPVASPQTTSHTYTVDWTAESITWAIDGTVVRTLPYAAANGGQNYPQTPMRVRIGNWAGGAPGNAEGTIEWAGGETDFSKAPFTMSVSSVKVTNYSPGSEYVYKDMTGSYESIEVVNGGAKGSAGVFAPSDVSTSASAAPSTTTEAGTTVKPSSTSVATSIMSSVASSGAQLTTIPLQASSTKTSTSVHSSAATSSSVASSTIVTTTASRPSASVRPSSSVNGTSPSSGSGPSPTPEGKSAGVALGTSGNAIVALTLFVAAAFVMA